jgi:pimeloyl-ACP methyl ester carboxylesterase
LQTIIHHPESQIDANGITITYDSFGDQSKPVILLIMGLATQLIHWDEDFCKKLASHGYWVIRFDNRDIGKSTKFSTANTPNIVSMLANQWFGRTLKAPYLLDDMAEDALALLTVLQIEKAHVVGVSMGGMIAQCMAIKAPDRVRRPESTKSQVFRVT